MYMYVCVSVFECVCLPACMCVCQEGWCSERVHDYVHACLCVCGVCGGVSVLVYVWVCDTCMCVYACVGMRLCMQPCTH